MKKVYLAACAATLCAGVSHADLLVAAPGLPTAVFIPSTEATNTATLSIAPASDSSSTYSEYRITGIEYVLKGGTPQGGSLKNNGATLGSDGKSISIENTVTIDVKYDGVSQLRKSATLNVDNNKDSLSGSFSLAGDLVANDASVTIEVTQSFSNNDVLVGDYSYIIVEGTYAENSASPEGFIQRKSTTMHEVLSAEDSCAVEFGVSLGLLDSGSNTDVKNNNGFGNNEDFIDGSNKNAIANASKWARSGKIDLTNETMATLLDDDEK